MAQNETNGGLSLEALLAAARGSEAVQEPTPSEGAAAPEPSTAASGAAAVANEEAPSDATASEPAQVAAAASEDERQAEPASTPSTGGFDLAAALGYGSGQAPRPAEGSSQGSVVSTGGFDLAAALGYQKAEGASRPAEPTPGAGAVDPVALAQAAAREEQAQAAADVVAREAIARAAREEGASAYRSRYADLPRRGEESMARGAQDGEVLHTHEKAVSRMADASARAAQAALAAQQEADGRTAARQAEAAPVTFKASQGASQPSRAEAKGASEDASAAKRRPAEPSPTTAPEAEVEAVEAVAEEEPFFASSEPAFMTPQEVEERAARQAAEEAAAQEAARLAAQREAEEAAAREAAAQQEAFQQAQAQAQAEAEAQARAQAQAAAQAQAQAAAAAAAAAAAQAQAQAQAAPPPAPAVRPRKAKVTATEEIMVEPLPSQHLTTISYEDAVFAEETRQMETAAERKASKKARRYRRLGTFLIVLALLAAAGAVALFVSGTANASEDIEAKATEISEAAGRQITYRYRAADSNGTLCPTTEVASFSTGGVLEQSVITMQTSDFETAAHTLANFKKQFQDNAYVDGRVDNSSVVFTLHMSSEHLLKSTYTALVMTNTVGCEVII